LTTPVLGVARSPAATPSVATNLMMRIERALPIDLPLGIVSAF
jgi:hypothetical protein